MSINIWVEEWGWRVKPSRAVLYALYMSESQTETQPHEQVQLCMERGQHQPLRSAWQQHHLSPPH